MSKRFNSEDGNEGGGDEELVIPYADDPHVIMAKEMEDAFARDMLEGLAESGTIKKDYLEAMLRTAFRSGVVVCATNLGTNN